MTESSKFGLKRSIRSAFLNVCHKAQPPFNVLINLALVVVVIRHRRVYLRQAQMRMLALNVLGVPMVSQMVQNDLHDLGRSTGNHRHSVWTDFDVRVINSTHLILQRGHTLVSKTATCRMRGPHGRGRR